MKTAKERIVQRAQRLKTLTSAQVVRLLGISRQTAAQHLRELVFQKKLLKIGSTRSAYYIPYDSKKARAATRVPDSFKRHYSLRGLDEDQVFQEMGQKLSLKARLSKPGYQIASYAFTEILNNAIDHSNAKGVEVELQCKDGVLCFQITDRGIGAFESIRKKFRLRNHLEAAEHLLKGKQTTDPKRHSGQGIFFTSRIADRFSLESGELELHVDNTIPDTFLSEKKLRKGTRVRVQVKQRTRKDLKALFHSFSGDDYEFDKTQITIHLSPKEGMYVARSEAKRLLYGLDRFRRIVFDFKKVSGIGQGFADEIFRVFQRTHPRIQLKPINMNPSVEFLITRARA